MNNYVPEGLQEFTEYKNEFLRKIQKATAPYHEAAIKKLWNLIIKLQQLFKKL